MGSVFPLSQEEEKIKQVGSEVCQAQLKIGCNFKLVYCCETEAKKRRNFFGEPPFKPLEEKFEPIKKIRGVNRLIKEVESEYSVLEDS